MSDTFFKTYAASVVQAIKDAGHDLQGTEAQLRAFLETEIMKLAGAADEPGYGLALAAAKDAALLAAGIATVDAADAAQARVIGIIFGALTTAVRLL